MRTKYEPIQPDLIKRLWKKGKCTNWA